MAPCWALTSGANSESSIWPTVKRSRWPCSMRVNLARLVLSQSCSLLRSVVSAQVADHGVDVVLELGHFAARLDLNRAREIALGDGGGDFRDGAHLRRQVGGEEIDVVGQILPRAGGAGHVGLAAKPAFDADFARHRRHLLGERRQRVGHVVDRVGERGDFALGFDGELLPQVAVGDGGHDLHDAAHLVGEVGGHDVDVVGEILPGAGDAGDAGLAAELAFGADLARHARHFGREGVQLIHHRVDGVLQLENFAFHVDGDLARQVAARDGGRDLGDVAHLRRSGWTPWR